MIKIMKSETADTRTCDVNAVTKEQLLKSSYSHIADVRQAMTMFEKILIEAGEKHDYTKIDGIEQFFKDFKTDFKEHEWWDNHRKEERHHISFSDGVKTDIDLIDVLEYIADCVMAGMARTGKVYDVKLSNELLQLAFKNTVDKLISQVEVQQ